MTDKVVMQFSDLDHHRHLVFVYGTLKKEHGNGAHDRYLNGAVFIGRCSIQGVMLHLGGCPGLVPDDICRVTGEVYEVTSEDVQAMDRYESVPHNYLRKLIVTPFGTAWTYYKNNAPNPPSELALCVDRGVWAGGNLDRMPYNKVRDYYINKRWLEPGERFRPIQPIVGDVIPASSPAANPSGKPEQTILNRDVPPPVDEKPKTKLVIKPIEVGPGLGFM